MEQGSIAPNVGRDAGLAGGYAAASLLTALRLIRDTRDSVADGGAPPWDEDKQGFDDWAADVADAAIANANDEPANSDLSREGGTQTYGKYY